MPTDEGRAAVATLTPAERDAIAELVAGLAHDAWLARVSREAAQAAAARARRPTHGGLRPAPPREDA